MAFFILIGANPENYDVFNVVDGKTGYVPEGEGGGKDAYKLVTTLPKFRNYRYLSFGPWIRNDHKNV